MVTNDQDARLATVRAYTDAIAFAYEVSDQTRVDLLIRILKMEEGHVGLAEIQRAQTFQAEQPLDAGETILIDEGMEYFIALL